MTISAATGCPVLVYKRTMPDDHMVSDSSTSQDYALVAAGSVANVDPDRIVLKKVTIWLLRCLSRSCNVLAISLKPVFSSQIILTGIPLRVRKKYAVVKHMFHDPMDVKWFRPAELSTKHGLRAHVKEPVGTHGLFKACFSAPVKQNDTVMLVLYKRMFPKFPAAGLSVI